ncbi:MAG: nucleotidyltransferase domain-containing protein, partial [Hymenobacteraceae bacterium]|nr:nucleotidyltransferase domain-containing protein [Hymenobacteraceae bacterium]MDX5394599.1 nucleotidyltransferase domain-containing protein [Hymenobacteraceae bacterium]MDX5510627.1 nucleotidyltransferase domain-containing protein [Hymenobacteraceae bacterium]
MRLQDEIQARLQEFINLCKKHNVKLLYGFGSAVTNRFDENKSDIDLLIEIDEPDPIERGEKLMSVWDKL